MHDADLVDWPTSAEAGGRQDGGLEPQDCGAWQGRGSGGGGLGGYRLLGERELGQAEGGARRRGQLAASPVGGRGAWAPAGVHAQAQCHAQESTTLLLPWPVLLFAS